MSPKLYAALRTLAQFLYAFLIAHVALPAALGDVVTETLILGALVGVVTYAIRWLETREGDSVPARVARAVAHVLMVGLSTRQPAYLPAANAATGQPEAVAYANGTVRRL